MIAQLKTTEPSMILPITNQWSNIDLSMLTLLQKVILVQQINDYITQVGENGVKSETKKQEVSAYLQAI